MCRYAIHSGKLNNETLCLIHGVFIVCIAGWKVLVMDSVATRVISSALTMYDIMERRVTLVEQLAINRQPFPEMDVIYLVSPTMEACHKISADFESRQKSKYGNVHLFFIDAVSQAIQHYSLV